MVVHDLSQRKYPVLVEPEWADEDLRLAATAGDGFIFHPAYTKRTNTSFGLRPAR